MLKIDVENLEGKVKPMIHNNKKHLEKAKDIINSISVPGDFADASKLKKLPEDIINIKNKINTIEKWIESSIVSFKSCANKNNNIVQGLKVSTINVGKTNSTQAKNIKEVNSQVKDEKGLSSILADMAKNIIMGGNVVSTAINSIVSDVISVDWKSVLNEVSDIADQIVDTGASVIASCTNTLIAVVKGIAELVGGLVDAIVIIWGAGCLLVSEVGYLASKLVKAENSQDWKDAGDYLWKSTMSFVAESHVKNAFKDFYQKTEVGKWLDATAFGPFKSDGMVSNVVSGIGYVLGIVALTYFTMGIGTVVSGAGAATSTATTVGVQAGIAGFAAVGKYTEEKWIEQRDASWQGINRLYENGEITVSEYNAFAAIRQMSESEWDRVEIDYLDGKITQEQYEQMKSIREMPDEWRTLENGMKGLSYGAVNAVWEGVQYYVGGKLAQWTIEGKQLATSAVRVGIDTGFNAADTPFRALVETILSEKSFEQAWKDQGGMSSVLVNTLIGMIGSVGGEVFDNIKSKNLKDTNIETKIENVIDPEHGFQLNVDDLGEFFKAKYKQGFFNEEQINNMLKAVNSKGFLDENTGKFLKSLFEDDNSNIYIKTIMTDDADSIMDEGIRCLGAGSKWNGIIPQKISEISLENTITDVTGGGLFELIAKLKGANGVSQGGNPINGAVILKVPKDMPFESMFKYNDELQCFDIDPRFNVGVIGCDSNGVLDSKILVQLTENKNQKIDLNLENNYEIHSNLKETLIDKNVFEAIVNDGKIEYRIDENKLREVLGDNVDFTGINNICNELNSASAFINSFGFLYQYDDDTIASVKKVLITENARGKIDLNKITFDDLQNRVNYIITKRNDIATQLMKSEMFNDMDSDIAQLLRHDLLQEHLEGKIDLYKMTRKELMAKSLEYKKQFTNNVKVKEGLTQEEVKKLEKFYKVMNKGILSRSEQKAVDVAYWAFKNAMESGNGNATRLLEKVIQLKRSNRKVTFNIAVNPDKAYWDLSNKSLVLGQNFIDWNDTGTFAHEMGHMLFALLLKEKLPNNWKSILYNARDNAMFGTKLQGVTNNITKQYNQNWVIATKEFENQIKNIGYASIDDYIDAWAKSIEANLNSIGASETIKFLKDKGFDEKIVMELDETGINSKEIAITFVQEEILKRQEQLSRIQNGNDGALSDIIDAVFFGREIYTNGERINITYRHGAEYYNSASDADVRSFHEMIANFTQLKMSGDDMQLMQLKEIFGEDFYNALEETFNKFLQ